MNQKIFENEMVQVFWKGGSNYSVFYVPLVETVEVQVLSSSKRTYESYHIDSLIAEDLVEKNIQVGSPSFIDKIFNHFYSLKGEER